MNCYGTGIATAENKDLSVGSGDDDAESSSFGENLEKSLEMDRLKMVPFGYEVGVDYGSDTSM